MTQSELAEKLGYSDKSVSKWERAEGVPDIICLKNIADLFGVTVDYLLEEAHPDAPSVGQTTQKKSVSYKTDRRTIVLLAVASVWLLAGIVFLILKFLGVALPLVFIVAATASSLLLVIFNALWGRREWSFWAVELLVVTTLLLICYVLRAHNLWLLMTLAIPAAAVVWLACRVKRINDEETE